MPDGELGEGADLGDDAVALQDRAVVTLPPIAAVTVDNRYRHCASFETTASRLTQDEFFLHTTTRSASASLRRWDG